jgi:ArsR family transcriptional regulator
LREAGLIEGERRGTWIYYRPIPEALGALATVLRTEQSDQIQVAADDRAKSP